MLTIRDVILAKIESAYGTDPTPTGADNAILVHEPSWSLEGARMFERKPPRGGSLAPMQSVFGGTLKQVQFKAELRGAGEAYSSSVRPELDPLFRSCGFSAAVVTTSMAETVTYEPASSSHESCTIYYYQDGTVHKLTGCRGNVTFTLETGNAIMAEFTMTGHSVAATDAALASPTYDSTIPPPFIGATVAVHSYSAIISSLSIDLSNQVITPANPSASDGYGEIRIVSRDINGSFDPEHTLAATHNWEGRWRAGNSGALSTGAIGGTQYNRFSFTLPAVYYKELAPGDRDGIRSLDMAFGAVEDSGDDELTLLFN